MTEGVADGGLKGVDGTREGLVAHLAGVAVQLGETGTTEGKPAESADGGEGGGVHTETVPGAFPQVTSARVPSPGAERPIAPPFFKDWGDLGC